MDRLHSYLESRRRDLCAGKLISYHDKWLNCVRFFWLDIRTGNIFELNYLYWDCFPNTWDRFSCLSEYSLKAGHVVPNWTYYLPF